MERTIKRAYIATKNGDICSFLYILIQNVHFIYEIECDLIENVFCEVYCMILVRESQTYECKAHFSESNVMLLVDPHFIY